EDRKADLEAKKENLEAKKNEREAKKDELEAKKDEFLKKYDVTSADMLDEDVRAEYDALVAEGEDIKAEAEAAKEEADELVAEADRLVAEAEALIEEANATKAKYEKQQAEFEKFQTETIPQIKSQFDFVFPAKSEIQDMLKDDGSAKNRLNNNTDVLFNEETQVYTLKINASALTDKTEDYIADATGFCAVQISAVDFKPIKVEFYRASVTAQENNNNAVATITDTVVDFLYPTEAVINVEVKDEKSLDEFINGEKLAEIISKYASDMVKIPE
ncbi:MAG: hypothetical protein Q4D76_14560, partial [Oscillospiraceae bacterium]|nr:hypothetical protein [Oscillospiraceae bacterium]